MIAVRQPIYDAARRVAALELRFFDHGHDGALRACPPTVARAAEALGGSRPTYLTVTRELLLGRELERLSTSGVVLQVGPRSGDDEGTIAALRRMRAQGFEVALDGGWDFMRSEPAVRSVDVVCLDASAGPAALRRDAHHVRSVGHCRLVARGVDCEASLDVCRSLDVELVQGCVWARPTLDEARGLRAGVLAAAALLAELRQEEPDLDAVHEIVRHDIGLSHGVLRFANSAFFALPRTIESVRDACVLLGSGPLRRWATTVSLAKTGEDERSALNYAALVRARVCELIAEEAGHRDPGAFYTTGLLSAADSLTDQSMVETLASLPLSDDINDAILNCAGAKGAALRAAVACEEGADADRWDTGLRTGRVRELHREAMGWADRPQKRENRPVAGRFS